MKKLNFLLFTAFILIAGCSSTNTYDENEDRYGVETGGTDSVYEGGGSYDGGGSLGYNDASNGDFYDDPSYGIDVVGGPQSPAKDRVIYFTFDSSNLDSRANAIVYAHANYLKNNPQVKMLLEGHTDEVGSREYNIALGERRALSVLKALANSGANPSQIRVISYGEENPAVRGYTEDAYKRNRRAVIRYIKD